MQTTPRIASVPSRPGHPSSSTEREATMARGVHRDKFRPTETQTALIESFKQSVFLIADRRSAVRDAQQEARTIGQRALQAGVPRVILADSIGSRGAVNRILLADD